MTAIVTLYEHHSYNQGLPERDHAGLVIPLNTSWLSLSHVPDQHGNWVNFNDRLTSYHVRIGWTVIFYKDDNFGVEMFRVPPKPNDEPHMENWPEWYDHGVPSRTRYNDNISSVRILDPNGHEIPQP